MLDSNGSMSDSAGGGETKIQAAKRALADVVSSLPADAVIGMRVFGAEVFSRDQPGACTDSQQVVAPSTDDDEEEGAGPVLVAGGAAVLVVLTVAVALVLRRHRHG